MIPRYTDLFRRGCDPKVSSADGVRATVAEGSAGRAPASGGWLGADECRELAVWRSPRRRDDWLRGRYLAKRHLFKRFGPPVSDWREVQILTRDESSGRGTPARVWIGGKRSGVSLSIAHAGDWVGVVSTDVPGCRVGIDLVVSCGCPIGFAETWFTDRERSGWPDHESDLPLTMWAAKEAWFKASGASRFQPRCLELTRGDDGFVRSYEVETRGGPEALIGRGDRGSSIVVETGRDGGVIWAIAVGRSDDVVDGNRGVSWT